MAAAVNGFYYPNTYRDAFARALHFIALAGFADVMIGKRLRELKLAASRETDPRRQQAISREWTELLDAFNRQTRVWWDVSMCWPRAYYAKDLEP